jgi:hypothetical protein
MERRKYSAESGMVNSSDPSPGIFASADSKGVRTFAGVKVENLGSEPPHHPGGICKIINRWELWDEAFVSARI